eukprot:scaffold7558_cov109-Isochrysis_galbana.AAC.6
MTCAPFSNSHRPPPRPPPPPPQARRRHRHRLHQRRLRRRRRAPATSPLPPQSRPPPPAPSPDASPHASGGARTGGQWLARVRPRLPVRVGRNGRLARRLAAVRQRMTNVH